MSEKKSSKKMGRPKIEINKKQFEKLCEFQCTEEEIADFFNCSIDTINNYCKKTYSMTFSDTFKKKSSKGKVSLRRNQFALSKKNSNMAIFLGKQYLGQKDIQTLDGILSTPTLSIKVVDNSNLEKVLYEEEDK